MTKIEIVKAEDGDECLVCCRFIPLGDTILLIRNIGQFPHIICEPCLSSLNDKLKESQND